MNKKNWNLFFLPLLVFAFAIKATHAYTQEGPYMGILGKGSFPTFKASVNETLAKINKTPWSEQKNVSSFLGGAGLYLGYLIDLGGFFFAFDLNGSYNLELSKSNDMGNSAVAIFFLNVVNHFVTPLLAKIHIKIRHAHTLWVEKSLKKKLKANRVNIRNC